MWRHQTGQVGQKSKASDRIEGNEAVVSRLAGAIVRAALVVLLVVSPSVLLHSTGAETTQVVALIAILCAIFTFVEYNSAYPSLVEFRDAPPYNRIRFLAFFATVIALSLICKAKIEPTTTTTLMSMIGHNVAEAIDFPYSPVRLAVLMLPDTASADLINDVRVAAGLSYLASILSLGAFVLAMRFGNWPGGKGAVFNVWVNLPTFDPTAGGDVVARLERDSHVNLILGFLLPFLIPAIVKLASDTFDPISLSNPHTLVWMMAAWAFLPASMIMRGLALARLTQMITCQRERAYLDEQAEDAAATA